MFNHIFTDTVLPTVLAPALLLILLYLIDKYWTAKAQYIADHSGSVDYTASGKRRIVHPRKDA